MGSKAGAAKATKRRLGSRKGVKLSSSRKEPAEDMSDVDFATLQVRELRQAVRTAAKHGSWQAFAALKRAEDHARRELVRAKERAKPAEEEPEKTPQQLFDDDLAPAVRSWPRSLVERLHFLCLEVLQMLDDDDEVAVN